MLLHADEVSAWYCVMLYMVKIITWSFCTSRIGHLRSWRKQALALCRNQSLKSHKATINAVSSLYITGSVGVCHERYLRISLWAKRFSKWNLLSCMIRVDQISPHIYYSPEQGRSRTFHCIVSACGTISAMIRMLREKNPCWKNHHKIMFWRLLFQHSADLPRCAPHGWYQQTFQLPLWRLWTLGFHCILMLCAN